MPFRSTAPLILGAALLAAAPAYAKTCHAPDARAQERAFSRAVITEGGRTIYLGGQTATNAEADFDTQVREVFASLDKTIKAVGGNGIGDMVTMTVFVLSKDQGDRFVAIRKETFKECFPASALITVSGFARPGLLLEIQGIAVVGGK